MSKYTIIESTKKEIDFIENKIVEYNECNVPFELSIPYSKINKNIKDENDNIIAGINCIYYSWKCIYIDALWVKEEYRKARLGSQLLDDIEATAKEYGCHLVHLDTFDFQAKDFYIKHGYEIYGVLDDCPLDHKRYYLRKYL